MTAGNTIPESHLFQHPAKFCWDACLFIAHLNGEARPEAQAAGMREVLEMIRTGKAHIITSAVVSSEVLNRAADAVRARDSLHIMLARPGFTVVDANLAIATKAGEFRERVNYAGSPFTLKRNDAIYVATAAVYGVDALHTFDPDLLRLNGSPLIDKLVVTEPRGLQTTLAL